ncbi:hypothetical protein PPERSA_07711 [Pseudocohnilembus persalinus]|uniref:Transmembrane protein n=1 Tax=Pseudocohnilembus persalinus TaxID=266149 RepID=A0A0V0R9R6_PSEPJ|nr:hypothetical protein PPERSA_07711 [Pseudocohnilembus persalinus]|eukprot:KRX11186.1 hypothetical protein PPERSA_07711 [Pseudocohnilembus persalinus]
MQRLLQSSKFVANYSQQLTRNTQALAKYPVGSDKVIPPPKDYFQYHYVFEVYPDALSGFKTHKKDPFIGQQFYAYETFEFQYEGQWWDIGSLFVNILYFTCPLWLYLIVVYENKKNSQRRGTKNKTYHTQGGYFHYQLYDVYEDPIIKD